MTEPTVNETAKQKQWNLYRQVMVQDKYPDGVKSKHLVVCTQQQADEKIGTLYPDNPAWRVEEMVYIRPHMVTRRRSR